MNRIIIAEHFENATEAQVMDFIQFLADVRGIDLEKAVQGGVGGEKFEEWFLKELFRRGQRQFASARDQIWDIVVRYLESKGGVMARLSVEDLIELEQALFEAGLAHSSHFVGISVRDDVKRRLERLGWQSMEILDLPGWSYRFALMRELIESGNFSFAELVRAASSHPISEAEIQAINIARQNALNALRPIFDRTGRLITSEILTREQDMLRRQVVEALEQRRHPLALARDMFKLDASEDLFRDFERVARTEMASAFSQGAFQADRESGKFENDSLVFRTTRPDACKVCLALYVRPDGTPTLYRVRDLENGTTPLIDVGVRKQRLYRAVLGATHPNELCSPWQKYHGAVMEPLFKRFAAKYRDGRRRFNLEVAEAA